MTATNPWAPWRAWPGRASGRRQPRPAEQRRIRFSLEGLQVGDSIVYGLVGVLVEQPDVRGVGVVLLYFERGRARPGVVLAGAVAQGDAEVVQMREDTGHGRAACRGNLQHHGL